MDAARVPVTRIEEELRSLWSQEAGDTDSEVVLRACLLNLVIFSDADWQQPARQSALSEIASHHPSRIVHISPAGKGEELSARAEIRCHGSSGGRRQVCCEVVHIEASEEAEDRLPSLIRNLSVPDLPSVLWWDRPVDLEDPLFEEISASADHIIIDTSGLEFGRPELRRLSARIEKSRWTRLSDLNWSRLTPWRTAVADFFDPPTDPALLGALSKIDIAYGSESEGRLPLRPLLIASWIGSRLEWTVLEPLQQRDDDHVVVFSSAAGQPLEVRFLRDDSCPPESPGRLSSLRLSTEPLESGSALFEARIDEECRHIITEAREQEGRKRNQVYRLRPPADGELINIELDVVRPDKAYEEALSFAARTISGEEGDEA